MDVGEYIRKFSLYKEYASRIRNLVQDLVECEGVEFYAVEGWAKDPGELLSVPANEEAGELVTVRVLLRFPEDVYRIEKVVRAEFEVDEGRSTPSSSFKDPVRFGYPSVVYTLALSSPRASLREWGKYDGLTFRLDLRTLLQEAWAAISPKVSVGAASENERKHKLFLLSALLEQADEGFLALKREAAPEDSPYGESGGAYSWNRGFTEEELYHFFKETPGLFSHWNDVALEAGFPSFTPDSNYLRESFGYLCRIFRAAGIRTLDEVKAFLQEMDTDERGLNQLKTVHEAFAPQNVPWRVDPFSAIFLLVLNARWDALKGKDLVALNIKRGSDRIGGME